MTKIKGNTPKDTGTKEKKPEGPSSISETKKHNENRHLTIKHLQDTQHLDGRGGGGGGGRRRVDVRDITRRFRNDLSIKEKRKKKKPKHSILVNLNTYEIIVSQQTLSKEPIISSLSSNPVEFDAGSLKIPIVIRIIPVNDFPITITMEK